MLDCNHSLCVECCGKLESLSVRSFDTSIVQCPLCRASTNLCPDDEFDDRFEQNLRRQKEQLEKQRQFTATRPRALTVEGRNALNGATADGERG